MYLECIYVRTIRATADMNAGGAYVDISLVAVLQRRDAHHVHVRLHRLHRGLARVLEQRTHVHVPPEVREARGRHLVASVVGALAQLGDQQAGAAARQGGELVDGGAAVGHVLGGAEARGGGAGGREGGGEVREALGGVAEGREGVRAEEHELDELEIAPVVVHGRHGRPRGEHEREGEDAAADGGEGHRLEAVLCCKLQRILVGRKQQRVLACGSTNIRTS
mmetsp:Transcript_59584/g.158558  ORF Transcript_59584/g.158558 Transcript_59584/m.158558 type:complete len:222 (+) Transcript_59584:131-796(+)